MTSKSRICLPGFGIPLGTIPNWPKMKFPSALSCRYEALLTTKMEFTLMWIMNRITDVMGWEEKVFNEEILNKWRAELVTSKDSDEDGDDDDNDDEENGGEDDEVKQKDKRKSEKSEREVLKEIKLVDLEEDGWEYRSITNKMLDWCFVELKHKAELFKKTDCVESLDGIFKSDTIISNDLREALIKATAPLENVPARDKDWRSGSGERILDLVNPSMYPLVYGQSRILVDKLVGLDDCIRRCGEGETLSAPSMKIRGTSAAAWSSKFQCLPSEFGIPVCGQDVQIMSYINNLHPKTHKDLYYVIEQIVAKAIPLWNLTLMPLTMPEYIPLRVQVKGRNHEDESPPEQKLTEGNKDYYYRLQEWKRSRKVHYPKPGRFKPPEQRFNETYEDVKYEDYPPVDLRKDFGRLQIIVKLANIYLTPEKPTYGGGSWHVEGLLNENICATALYYYEMENISTSLLLFRRPVDPDGEIPYKDDVETVKEFYGIDSDGPSIQDIGGVVAKEGRLLTFPNTIQNRIAPFGLSDPTKPGHRKMLALFLIDPCRLIISTANVPCQQRDIWADQVRKSEPLSSLPSELADQIVNYEFDFPVSVDVAKDQSFELMEERMAFTDDQNYKLETINNFCLREH